MAKEVKDKRKTFTITVNEKEREEIERKAEAHGFSLSAYVRWLVKNDKTDFS